MATNQLTTTSGSGTQGSTQTPQSAGSTATGAPVGSVQPGGTASALLSGQAGVPLRSTALSTVNLTPATATTSTVTQNTALPVVKRHHVNAAFLGISVLLLLVALVLFWATSRSAKSTT